MRRRLRPGHRPGEADLSSIAQLNEYSPRRYQVQAGTAVLLNPQATVALTPDRLRAAETFTVLGRTSAETTSEQRRLWLNGGQDQ